MRPQHGRNSCFFLLPYANDLPKTYNFELGLGKHSGHKYNDIGKWPGQRQENRVWSSLYGTKKLNEDFLFLGHYTTQAAQNADRTLITAIVVTSSV